MSGLTRHRTVALHRGPRRDPVTPQVWAEVVARDRRIAGGCVAPHLDSRETGKCRDKWGGSVWAYAALTVDHIREHSGGQRRSEPRWLVTLCYGHHINGMWATSHRPLLRAYLLEVAP